MLKISLPYSVGGEMSSFCLKEGGNFDDDFRLFWFEFFVHDEVR